MPVVLYKIDSSPPCRAVNMILELIELKVVVKIINTRVGEQLTAEFLALNPLHTVPVIEDGDFVLADSHAIIMYLVSKYGADKRSELYPNDLTTRATVHQKLFFDAATLYPRLRDLIVSFIGNTAPGSTEKQEASTIEAYGFLEKYLELSPYLVGNHLTIADVSVVATVSTLDGLLPIDERFPKLTDWFNRIKEQDWYEKGNVNGLNTIVGFLNKLKS